MNTAWNATQSKITPTGLSSHQPIDQEEMINNDPQPELINPAETATQEPTPVLNAETAVPTATPTPTSTPEPQLTPVGQEGAWTLLFNDEFEGEAIDTNKWATCYWWGENGCNIGSNNELE
ncbi:MAG: hypothetical protein PVF74_15400, partial [Anaerolineales bacterium]